MTWNQPKIWWTNSRKNVYMYLHLLNLLWNFTWAWQFGNETDDSYIWCQTKPGSGCQIFTNVTLSIHLILSQWFLNLLSNQAWLPNWQPRLGLTEDSRTTGTDFESGSLFLILTWTMRSRQLWTYLTSWKKCKKNWTSLWRGLKQKNSLTSAIYAHKSGPILVKLSFMHGYFKTFLLKK